MYNFRVTRSEYLVNSSELGQWLVLRHLGSYSPRWFDILYSKSEFENSFPSAWIKRAKIGGKKVKTNHELPFQMFKHATGKTSFASFDQSSKKKEFIQIVSKQNWFFILLMWFIVILLFTFTGANHLCISNALSQKYRAARFPRRTIKMFVCVMGAYIRSIMHIEFHHQLTRKMMSSTRFPAH